MSSLCAYKNIFGAPNTGLHAYRIFNLAIVDIVLTLIVAMIISAWYGGLFWKSAGILFLSSIFFHWLFCVPTTVTVALGLA